VDSPRAPVSGLAQPVGVGSLAVVFSSLRTDGDGGYAQTAEEMVALAARQPGFDQPG